MLQFVIQWLDTFVQSLAKKLCIGKLTLLQTIISSNRLEGREAARVRRLKLYRHLGDFLIAKLLLTLKSFINLLGLLNKFILILDV